MSGPAGPPSPRRSGPSAQRILGGVAAWRDRVVLRYATAIASTAAALGVTALAQAQLQRSIFVLCFAAVTFSAWIGGIGPALLAALLSVLGVDYFVLEPRYSLDPASLTDMLGLVVFGSVSALIAWLTDSARRSERRASAQAAELERQAAELKDQIEESRSLQEELEQSNKELALANEHLEQSREFLEQAQRSAQLGSWEWDIRANQVTWSKEMFRVYGREPGSVDVSYETFLELVHPDDREMVRRSVEHAFQTHEPFAFDHRVVWPDGAVRWLHGRGRVVTDAEGKAVRMVGSGQDITERRRASEAQRLLAEASEALASSTDYGVTLSTVANLAVRSLADWCSVAIGDATGRHEIIAVAHRDPERIKWALEYSRLYPPRFDSTTGVAHVLRTGRSEFYPEISRELLVATAQSEAELRVLEELQIHSAMVVPMVARDRALGAITFIAAESAHRYTAEDLWLAERLAGRAAVAIDNARLFDEARAARAEAEAANRAKMEFLATMSHELRTPLNAIAGYSELLTMEIHGPLTEGQRETLARMRRSQGHLLALVEEVLGFAKVEAGQMSFEIAETSVHDVLARMGELVAPQAAAKKVRYEYDGCEPSLSVLADRERLEQIILNLVSNAVKFTSDGGRVTLAADGHPDTVVISVADTGIGIPADKLATVFEPFVQLRHRTDRRASGVGLGLAISRDLALAMNGDIAVESILGKGSTFTLRLPRASNRASESKARAEKLPAPNEPSTRWL
jgi:PAS domain S-box-containing protein